MHEVHVGCWEETPMLSCWYCPCQWMLGHEGRPSGEVSRHGHTLRVLDRNPQLLHTEGYHLLLMSTEEGAYQRNGSGSVVCHWEVSSLKISTTDVRVCPVSPPATVRVEW